MLVAKIILCVSTFISCFLMRTRITYHLRQYDLVCRVGIASAIAFCLLMIITWNVFTIPKILFFVSICIYILNKIDWETCIPYHISMMITVITFLVALNIYCSNIVVSEVPEITTSETIILSVKDNSDVSGHSAGNYLHVYGNISEECVYRYYYQLEDGGIKQDSVPAKYTTIYYIEEGEQAYLETIVATTYSYNYNEKPATKKVIKSITTFKLYVPEGSISTICELDAE